MKLSTIELEVLRNLPNGEAVAVSSNQRVRLEMAGAIREGVQAIRVTSEGQRLSHGVAHRAPATALDEAPTQPRGVAKDCRGRRLPFQRRSIF